MTHRYLDFSQSTERKLLAELWKTLQETETDEDPLEEIQRWVEIYRADRRRVRFSHLLNAFGWKQFPINIFGVDDVFIGNQAEFNALLEEYERDNICKSQDVVQKHETMSLLELTEKVASELFDKEMALKIMSFDKDTIAKVALALHDTVCDDQSQEVLITYAERILGNKIIKKQNCFFMEKNKQ